MNSTIRTSSPRSLQATSKATPAQQRDGTIADAMDSLVQKASAKTSHPALQAAAPSSQRSDSTAALSPAKMPLDLQGIFKRSGNPLTSAQLDALIAQSINAEAKIDVLLVQDQVLTLSEFHKYLASRIEGFNQDVNFKNLEVVSFRGSRLVDEAGNAVDAFKAPLQKISRKQISKACIVLDLRMLQQVNDQDCTVFVSRLIQHGLFYRRPKDGNGLVLLNPDKLAKLKTFDIDVADIENQVEILEKARGTSAAPFVRCPLSDLPKTFESTQGENLGGATDARSLGSDFVVKGAMLKKGGTPKAMEKYKNAVLQLHGEFLGLRALTAAGVLVPTTGIIAKEGQPVLVQQRIKNATALAMALTGLAEKDEAIQRQNLEAILPSVLIGDTDRIGLCQANAMVPNAPNGAPDRDARIVFFDGGASFHMKASGGVKKEPDNKAPDANMYEFTKHSSLGQLLIYISFEASEKLFNKWTPAETARQIRALGDKASDMQAAIREAEAQWNGLELVGDPVKDETSKHHSGEVLAQLLTPRMKALSMLADRLDSDGGKDKESNSETIKRLALELLAELKQA